VVTLFWRVVVLNAALIAAAEVALAASPATVSSPLLPTEALVLCAGVALIVVADWLLLRRAFVPLEDLKSLMARVDPLKPGERVRAAGGDREFGELARSFNQMMERLETERRDSARRATAVEEGERQRLSRELHDEIAVINAPACAGMLGDFRLLRMRPSVDDQRTVVLAERRP